VEEEFMLGPLGKTFELLKRALTELKEAIAAGGPRKLADKLDLET